MAAKLLIDPAGLGDLSCNIDGVAQILRTVVSDVDDPSNQFHSTLFACASLLEASVKQIDSLYGEKS